MEIVCTELSRYILVIIMAFYTFWGFMVFGAKKKKLVKLCRRQRIDIYLFYLIGNAIVYMNKKDIMVAGICVAGFAFFILSALIYQRIYQKSNLPILNHMHMCFAVSLVMLERLNVTTAKKQLIYIVAGTVVCLFLPIILGHYRKLEKDGMFYAVLGSIFLIVVFVFGKAKYGAKNWLNIGPVALQPSEFSKILFVLGFAGILTYTKLNFRNVVKVSCGAAFYVGILVAEKDLGAALIFFICYLFMLFVATGKASYLFLGILAGSGAAVVAYQIFSHVRTRVMAWKDPWSTIDNQGFQVAQSLFAIGTGGFFGMGLTQGLPEHIPIRESDFIFAAISEELGAFFAVCIIMNYVSCFVLFIGIATKLENQFYKLVVLGYSVTIMFQTFLTLGGVTKFIPSTGVTLPLISAGGSSVLSMIVMFCMIAGINVNNSREVDYGQEAESEQYETE